MKLFRSTLLVSFASLLSRFLGVWRENLLASAFGGLNHQGSNPLDAYYAAFRIPDFLYNLVIMSVGAAIFVPIFARELKYHKEELNRILNNFMHVAMVILIAGSLLIYLFLPFFIDGLTLGFAPDNKMLTASLMKIMLLSPLFFGVSSILGSYLSVYKNFTAYIWSPLIYNLSIIGGIIFLVPHVGVYGVAYGVVLGAFLHMAIQFIPLIRKDYRYMMVCSFTDKTIQEVKRLVLPRIIGISAAQINLVVDTVIASTLASGSLTILNWSQNMQSLPSGLIGVSISVTVFTVLSDFAVDDSKAKFSKTFLQTLRMIVFLSLPVTIGFFLLKNGIVDIIFNYGKFSQSTQNAVVTANTLGIFTLSLLFQGLIPLVTRAFYAYQDTKTPVISAIYTVVLNIVLSIVFVYILHMGVLGLALSFSIANTFNALFLLYLLNIKILDYQLQLRNLTSFLVKTGVASLVMGIIVFLLSVFLGTLGHGKWMILFNLVLTTGVGALVFFGLSWLFHIEEVQYLLSKMVWRRNI
jgi:putative peptidoglycan lipid II flippase